jgi:hypothetical protein
MFESGVSYREISRRTGRSAMTVQRIVTRWTQEGSTTRRTGTGPPRRTTAREDRHIVQMAVADRRATAAQIRATVTDRVTSRTIVNRLLDAGLHSRASLRCIPLTRFHCQQRQAWCTARRNWTIEWQTIVFSDESRFCLGQSDSRQHVRRRPGERAHPDVVTERHTGPTPGVMVWGAISYDSRSDLVVVQGTMNARQYVDRVVQPVVIPFMSTIQNGVFQQDNARPHTAAISRQALQGVATIEWPARSPDLSPIEHVWDAMGRRLVSHGRPAQSVAELTTQVVQAWRDIPQQLIRTLFDSMPARVQECIRAHGSHTSY